MSTVARKIAACPLRTAIAAWAKITTLLSVEGSPGRAELESVAGVAASLISDECFRDAPALLSGNGPQVRIYCVYDDDSVEGDKVKEDSISFEAAVGNWVMSLPCQPGDLDWVNASLKERSNRITARDLTGEHLDDRKTRSGPKGSLEFDEEGFLST